MLKNLIATAAMAAALAATGAASASTIFYLTVNGCTSTCVPGGVAIGEVEVSGLGTNVLTFDVDLYGTATFNNAGVNTSHQAFGFNLVGDPAVTISSIVAAVSLSTATGNADAKASPFGNFDDVLFRPSKTGSQGGGGNTLDFTVTGAAGSHLLFDATEAQVLMEADVFSNGNTGSVGAVGPGTSVPEPAAWTMMLVGFGALGGLVRRRRAALAKATVG